MMQGRVVTQALIRSFNDGFIAAAIAFAAVLFVVWFMEKPATNVKVEGAH